MNPVPLHNHSEYSNIPSKDGFASTDEIVKRIQEIGSDAVGLTDHGVVSGHFDFEAACRKVNIKPIFGMEGYQARTKVDERHIDPKTGSNTRKHDAFHLILLAKTNEGLKNLWRLSSDAYTKGFYANPRVDWRMLEEFNKDIIATSACMAGYVSWDIEHERTGALERYLKIFGDRFYIELHTYDSDKQRQLNLELVRLAKKFGVPMVYATDAHFACSDDHIAHETLLAVREVKRLDDPDRKMTHPNCLWIQGEEDIRRSLNYLPKSVIDEAISNSVAIAEMCNVELPKPSMHVPSYHALKEGESNKRALLDLVKAGMARNNVHDNVEYVERVKKELSVIFSEDHLINYFLVQQGIVNHCRDQNILLGPGRGCLAPGSKVVTPSGFVNIEELRKGDVVFDQNGDSVVIPEIFEYDCFEKLVEVKAFYGGDGVRMTADHKVLVSKANRVEDKGKLAQGYKFLPDPSSLEWLRADEIEIGDLVVVPELNFPVRYSKFYVNPEHIVYKNIVTDGSKRTIHHRTGISRNAISDYQRGVTGERVTQVLDRYRERYSLSMEDIGNSRISTILKKSIFDADYEFGKFLGLFISDGWIARGKNNKIGIAVGRDEDTGQVPVLIEDLFGVVPVKYEHADKLVNQYVIYHKGLRDFISYLFCDYEYTAQTKYIPEFLFCTPITFRKGLLDGLWDGDGTHKERTKYTSSSKRLAEGVYTLLLSLGYPAGIKNQIRFDTRVEYNRTQVSKTYYDVLSSRRFGDVKVQNGHSLREGFIYYRVREVNEVDNPSGKVYDFTVPSTSSYVTDSFVVHNSAGGSLVAYLIGITDIDPIPYGLIFERFYNAGRAKGGLPDIDIDFPTYKRGEIKKYIGEIYGEDNIASLGTIIRLGPKSTIDKVQMALKEDVSMVSDVKAICDEYTNAGLLGSWDEIKEDERIVMYRENYPRFFELVDKLYNRVFTSGVHASGFLISDKPLANIFPLRWVASKKEVSTQFDMHEAERLGFMKNDMLGITKLDSLLEFKKIIKNRHGRDFAIEKTHHVGSEYLDDPEVWNLLDEGLTIGIFQLEAGVQAKQITRDIRPRSIDDLAAIFALNRPGPIRSGAVEQFINRRNGATYEITPGLEDILSETYGLFVYQEQVIQLMVKIGFTLEEADNVRRIMGKKKPEEMEALFPEFMEKATPIFGEDESEGLWGELESFSLYGFNKSHSVGYAVLAFWTLVAKAKYPLEYLLASIRTDPDNVALFISEARRMGYEVIPPDINESSAETDIVDGKILYGLKDVKGVKGDLSWVIKNRPFESMDDLINKLEADNKEFLKKKKAGEVPKSARSPKQLFGIGKVKALANVGAFDSVEESPLTFEERRNYEKELLGIVLTDRSYEVLHKHQERLDEACEPLGMVDANTLPGDTVLVYGRIVEVEEGKTRNGFPMAKVLLENGTESLLAFMFGGSVKKYSHAIREFTPVVAKLEKSDGGMMKIVDVRVLT